MPTVCDRASVIVRSGKQVSSAVIAVSILVLALGTSAHAAMRFPSIGKIAGPQPGAVFMRLGAEAVGVDAVSGRIYVADSGAGLVYSFSSPADTAPEIWDGSNTPAGSYGGKEGVVSVAVDDGTGDVYVADRTHRVIDKFDADGNLIKSFGDSKPTPDGQLAGLDTPGKSFAGVAATLGIAVDQANHDLYLIDSGHEVIDVFDEEGHFIPAKQITATPFGLYGCGGIFTTGIAVNAASGHVLVSDTCSEEVFEFDSSGVPLEAWTGGGAPTPFAGSLAVTVNNSSGDIYVANTFPSSEPPLERFTEAREYLEPSLIRTSETETGSVALDQANGDLYVADTTAAGGSVNIYGGVAVLLANAVSAGASEVRAASATLNGVVNPESLEVSKCFFEYVEEAAYVASAFNPYSTGGTIPCAETVGSGSSEIAVHADVSGLKIGTTYHYRLLVENENGTSTGSDQTLATTPPPVITAAAASRLTANEVYLSALIDPQAAIAGYRFEYGTTTNYGTSVPVPDGQLGSEPEEVAQHITGLSPNTTYHWRILASNEAGITASPDHTFDYLTGASTLPDSRAYEMITPPAKNGALIGDVFLGLGPDMSRDGERIILSSVQCFANAESCIAIRGLVGASFEFHRTPLGWQANSLAPSQQFEANSIWSVGADGGTALYSMPTAPRREDDIYVRQADGQFTDVGPTTPPEGGPQGAVGAQEADSKAATADFSRFVYGLREPAWPFDSSTKFTLYEYVGTHNSQPLLVGVTGAHGSNALVSVCGTNLGTGSQTTYPGAMSDDGRTIFFTATGRSNGECTGSGVNGSTKILANTLYARINEAETTMISGQSPSNCGSACQASPPADAEFQGASTDGKRVYFLSTQQLTDNASEDEGDSAASTGCTTASHPNGCNLYEYNFGRPAGNRLTVVSAGDSSGGGPRVEGMMAISDDGTHAYFIARGLLTSAPNAQGQTAQPGGNNLYAYVEGHVSFVAALSSQDKGEWELGSLVANVSPDGRFLVFESAGRLTGDTGTAGVEQVFRYDAATGELLRLSHGEAGSNDNGNSPTSTLCSGIEECPDAASVVRASAFFSFAGSWRRDPSMSDDGSYVFFQSPVGLTPGSLNDVQIGEESGLPIFAENIYEWHGGKISLISDGRDTSVGPTELCGLRSATCLNGASVSGRDVFFTTTDKLVPQDTDTQLDMYDARICSAGDPCIPPPTGEVAPCDGEACHGIPPGTPLSPDTPSASFNGAENPPPKTTSRPKACRRHFVKKHGRCVAVKKKHKAKKGRGRARKSLDGTRRPRQ